MTNNANDFVEWVLSKGYQVETLLGKKAGRKTVLAKKSVNNQLVVVKILTFGNDFSWEDLKLFEREAQTLQSINHRFIPKYLDFFDFTLGKTKGYGLVQSYVPGKSLEEYIQSGYKFTASEIQEIAFKLLAILEYLHQQQPPIIHRDIKPSNIILQEISSENLSPEPARKFTEYEKQDLFSVYLVDFGSVQTCTSKAGNTMTVVGTYGYMPPEQFGGRACPASDLYSLGATLIACATGIHPADLPHNDMQIDFARQTTLSENLINWLSWLTNPDLQHRPPDAKSAIAVLKRQSLTHHQKHISKVELLWQSLGRNVLVGSTIVPLAAGLYGTFIYPGIGSVAGAMIGLYIGFPTGIISGFCIWMITVVSSYPLRHPLVYKQVIQFFSTLIGCAGYLIGIGLWGLFGSSASSIGEVLLMALLPAIIVGLSLGVANKSLAHWYERNSNRKF